MGERDRDIIIMKNCRKSMKEKRFTKNLRKKIQIVEKLSINEVE